MGSKLEAIAKIRESDVRALKTTFEDEEHAISHFNFIFEKTLRLFGYPLNLYDAIFDHFKKADKEQRLFVASEFKRASPSKGIISKSNDSKFLVKQVLKYAKGNTNLVSVLTEEKHFKGSLMDMMTARETLQQNGYRSEKKGVLVLRKDFIVDKIQLYEARAYGADTVLLIVAILRESKLRDLIHLSRELGMEPLVEVATKKELDTALKVGARVIGVNNRDLHTFKVDLSTSIKVAEAARCKDQLQDIQSLSDDRNQVFLIALSGVKSREDVRLYEKAGTVAGVLIGETLMRADNPTDTLRSLFSDTFSNFAKTKIHAKVCGITDTTSARFCAEKGSSFIGLIFATKSKRKVTVSVAIDIVKEVKDFRENEGRVMNSNKTSHKEVLERIRKYKPLVVGVFQDQSSEYINEIVESVGLDIVQLHDTQVNSEKEKKIIVPTIRVIHVSSDLHFTEADLGQGNNFAFLLDTAVGSNSGGTGKSFDWTLVSTFVNNYQKINDTREIPLIFLAGGLGPKNVTEALKIKDVFAVDVASGVEINGKPGVKDLKQIEQFLKPCIDAT